jgi:hypothetical protein
LTYCDSKFKKSQLHSRKKNRFKFGFIHAPINTGSGILSTGSLAACVAAAFLTFLLLPNLIECQLGTKKIKKREDKSERAYENGGGGALTN